MRVSLQYASSIRNVSSFLQLRQLFVVYSFLVLILTYWPNIALHKSSEQKLRLELGMIVAIISREIRATIAASHLTWNFALLLSLSVSRYLRYHCAVQFFDYDYCCHVFKRIILQPALTLLQSLRHYNCVAPFCPRAFLFSPVTSDFNSRFLSV